MRAGDRRVDRPQGVVGSERHDHRVGAIGQCPFEPRQSVGSRVAGDASVDDADIEAAFAQRRLQPGGQGVAQGESVSRGEAVSEHQDAERSGASLRCGSAAASARHASTARATRRTVRQDDAGWRPCPPLRSKRTPYSLISSTAGSTELHRRARAGRLSRPPPEHSGNPRHAESRPPSAYRIVAES